MAVESRRRQRRRRAQAKPLILHRVGEIGKARLPNLGTQTNVMAQSARNTKCPSTIVATALPVSCHLSNGVFRDFDRDFPASNVQRFFGSKMVMSACAPFASVPRAFSPATRAG